MNKKKAKLSKTPPDYLGRYGKNLWRKLVPFLNENTEIIEADKYLFARYCSAYDIYREAYKSVQKDGQQKKKYKTTLSPVDGSIVARDFTGYAKNPAVQNMKDAMIQLNNIGKELGLSPKSRNELINLKKPKKEEKKEPVGQMMKNFFK